MTGEDAYCVSDAPTVDEQHELEDRLDRHNIEHTGIRDARLMSIMLRAADGALYAGLHGHTWGRCCEVKTLWVAQSHRGQGVGARLMQAAEAEAVTRGCRRMLLNTHSFQAPGFYEKCGFVRVASVEDCPEGHAYILMAKRIGG